MKKLFCALLNGGGENQLSEEQSIETSLETWSGYHGVHMFTCTISYKLGSSDTVVELNNDFMLAYYVLLAHSRTRTRTMQRNNAAARQGGRA